MLVIKQVIPAPPGKDFYDVYVDNNGYFAVPVDFFALIEDTDDGTVMFDSLCLRDGFFDTHNEGNYEGVYSHEEMVKNFPNISVREC